MLSGRSPVMFTSDPVDQFIDHCRIATFVEDDVRDFGESPTRQSDRFGSDWTYAEGLSHPRDFFANVASFSLDHQRKIMVENARSLIFA
jgi:hypothetical protein